MIQKKLETWRKYVDTPYFNHFFMGFWCVSPITFPSITPDMWLGIPRVRGTPVLGKTYDKCARERAAKHFIYSEVCGFTDTLRHFTKPISFSCWNDVSQVGEVRSLAAALPVCLEGLTGLEWWGFGVGSWPLREFSQLLLPLHLELAIHHLAFPGCNSDTKTWELTLCAHL